MEDTSSDKSDQTFETSTVLSSERPSKLTNANPNHQFYTDHVMMCEPTAFYLNEETIEDNKFMQRVTYTKEQSSKVALDQFNEMVNNLQKNNIKVTIYR